MSNNTPGANPQAAKPEGTVPQAIADDIANLAAEVRNAAAKAESSWKTGAVVWVIFLAVIFGYLYFGVYGLILKPFTDPETLVSTGLNTVNGILSERGFADLGSSRLVDQLAARINERGPEIVREQLKPELDRLQADLPKHRARLVELTYERMPELFDRGVEALETSLLPRVREQALASVGQSVDELLAQVDAEFGDVVDQVIAQLQGNLDDLQDKNKLGSAMRLAFEDAMGPVLDDMFADFDLKIAQVKEQMGDLIARSKTGNLTHEEELEIRLMQLVRALFQDVTMEPSESIYEQIMSLIEGRGVQMSEEAREQILAGARTAGPSGEIDLSKVPEDIREEVRVQIEAGRRRSSRMPAEAREAMEAARAKAEEHAAGGRRAAARAAGEARTEAAGGPSADMPEEARKAMEEGRKKAEEGRKKAEEARRAAMGDADAGAAPQGAPTQMPEEARKAMEEGRKKAEEARAKGEEAREAAMENQQ